jgi:hypothetical protein
MGVPMKWEIARIFVVGTGGSGFCAEASPSGVIGFFMAVGPYSSFGILLLIVSVFEGVRWMPPSSPAFRRSIGDRPIRIVAIYSCQSLSVTFLSTF